MIEMLSKCGVQLSFQISLFPTRTSRSYWASPSSCPAMSRALFELQRHECGEELQALHPPSTAAIDVWALGTALFCLIVGDMPFLTYAV